MARTGRCIRIAAVAVALGVGAVGQDDRPQFEASWESLNGRESPAWFEDAKFGIFIHWGVYSVPALCDTSTYSEWYWWWLKTSSHGGLVRDFHEKWYGEDFRYQDFAPMFRAELWDPAEWARLFQRAGAKYVVLVSKHHDGFALWPSEHASRTRGHPWNSVEVGPGRDLCGELTEAVRAAGLRMGFYYSFMEWENPLYDSDKARYVAEHMIPQIRDLVQRYRPAVFWPDGEWDHPDTLWRSTEILAELYNTCENPEELVVNDRWGQALRGQVGDYSTTEYGNIGGGSPGLQEDKPFEECRGIGHSFAFNRLEDVDAYLDRDELVRLLIDKVSRGGNLLLNLGPTADGRIPVIQQDRLVALGRWLEVNGEAIYGTRRGPFRDLPWGRATRKGDTFYLHVFDWPADHTLEVAGLDTPVRKAFLLHDPDRTALPQSKDEAGRLVLDLLGHHPFEAASVVALECDGPPVVSNRVLPGQGGVITLAAEVADLHGGVQLEEGVLRTVEGGEQPGERRTNVGYWAQQIGFVTWPVRVRATTRYRVVLEYGSAPGTEGGEFVLTLGDAELSGRIATHTGEWHVYATSELGEIQTGDEIDVEAAVRCVRLGGGPLMNLRRIVLEPLGER